MSSHVRLKLVAVAVFVLMFSAGCALGVSGGHTGTVHNTSAGVSASNDGVHSKITNNAESNSSFQYGEETLVLLNGTVLPGNFANKVEPVKPWAVAYDPYNGYVYVANYGLNDVYVINSSNSVIAKISVGTNPDSVAYDAFDHDVYVSNFGSESVSVISSRNYVVQSINLAAEPQSLTYDPSNHMVYTANPENDNISVINSTTGNVSSIAVSSTPHAVSYDPYNNYLYVAEFNSNRTSVINTTSGKIIDNITVGIEPYALTYDPSNNYIYVANAGSSNISIINASNVVTGTINVGITPESVAYDPMNKYMYVVDFGSSNVSVINSSNHVIGSVDVGEAPESAAYDPLNGYVYVADMSNGTLTMITPPEKNYGVAFTETGLPSGYAWNLTFNGSVYTLDNTSYVFYVQNGSYNYSASSEGYHGISGSVVVNGSNISVNLTFAPVDYSVSFSESGLPSGAEWLVNVTNTSTGYVLHGRSNLSDMPFFLSNGSYTYTVATVNKDYTPSPSSGSFNVNGSNSSVPVVFKELTYSDIFTETGLQPGVSWSVTFDGITDSSTSSSITFIVPNGTYPYLIGSVAGYTQPSNGTVSVNGSTVIHSVTFTRLTPIPEIHPKRSSVDTELYIIMGALIVAIIVLSIFIVRRKK
ncbi:MAG: YncE family protein [Thermoplasmatales archaeon]|nr:YncE family protein [Thermoplasmatales archaeon]MCW6170145.1 YncE family protein [Thermoplasmatales archaeon]